MALSLNQQIWEAIGRSQNILIVFRQENQSDGAPAALALASILKKMNKQVEIASSNFIAPKNWQFLTGLKEIKSQLPPLQKFIIKVELEKNKLASLSYDVKDNNLYIYLTPREGFLNREAVKTASTDLKYDLILVLDTPDLQSLGTVYDNNTELFYRTPVINLDHNPANEHFGKINLVDISAAATSEIILEFFQTIQPESLTPEVATLLLAGLIIKTKNFRQPNLTSRTLNNAGRLVDLGAKREDIVRHLYRQRTLASLKLWGTALANLKHDTQSGLVWLGLKRDDFRQAQATENDLPEIIDELLSTTPEAKIIVILYETALGEVAGLVSCHPHLDARLLAKPFNPTGTKERVKILIKTADLASAEKQVFDNIKTRLTQK